MSGIRVAVIVWIWRKFDDEHVRVIGTMMTRLNSQSFPVVSWRRFNFRQTESSETNVKFRRVLFYKLL